MNRIPANITRKMPAASALQNISPKVMVMTVLIAVMGILWGRVLLRGKSGPAAAGAQETAAVQPDIQSTPVSAGIRISPVALPNRPGRNDILSKDVFSGATWTAFDFYQSSGSRGSVTPNGGSAGTGDQSKLERIAARMTLEAVIKGDNGTPCRVFVNGKILTVGSTLTVKEGPDQYVLIVTDIKENKVEFSWNTVSVVLKMAEANNE
ncbi:MAG: hypothetical protein L0Y36_00880 [Planctomycetales bacterium]|nr:hypothetical protein [Planctomycetales bacterium]